MVHFLLYLLEFHKQLLLKLILLFEINRPIKILLALFCTQIFLGVMSKGYLSFSDLIYHNVENTLYHRKLSKRNNLK